MIYYDKEGFHATQNENNTRYPMTEEEVQTLFDEMNSKDQSEDVWRFSPDENGKPVIVKIDVDYIPLYRRMREKDCFPVINRGSFWYNTLTETQKNEIQAWYQEWLDVTETLILPHKPTWLK